MYTPGPWHANGAHILTGESSGFIVATVSRYDPRSEHEANARIMAAAPDLLAALERCELALNAGRSAVDTALREEVLAKVRAALGKARAP